MNHILNHIKKIKYVGIYGYKVVGCNDDEYSKPVQICKGENDVYKLIWKIQKYVEKDINVRDYCFIVIWPYITTKYRGSVHQDRNSNW